MNTFKDISNTIEQSFVNVLSDLNGIAAALNTQFLLIGAKARDLFFTNIFDIPARRATLDVDIAVRVKNWKQFQRITSALLESKTFRLDGKIEHRFRHKDSVLVDILPFGEIERPEGSITWLKDSGKVMSTVGFHEAWQGSVVVTVRREPELIIRLATPAALAIMKLVAWYAMYPERNDDAKDLQFFMKHYISAGNDARLYGEDKDLAKEEGFDYGLASPRLLGRDMARLAAPSTLSFIRGILERETSNESDFRLVHDMIAGAIDAGDEFQKAFQLLSQLRRGFSEQRSSLAVNHK